MHLLILSLSVFLTSLMSGIFGMLGGLILMGVLGALLPLAQAMVWHGLIQAWSNGYRVWIYRKDIQWRVLGFYFIGAILAWAVLYSLSYKGSKALLYFVLGALPFANYLKSVSKHFVITKPPQAFLCGIFIQSIQLIAGASGPILDLFYINSSLNRYQIMGTKALTQTLSHIIKIIFYSSLMVTSPDSTLLFLFLLSSVGNWVGHKVVDKMDDNTFKRWSFRICLVIGVYFLVKSFQEFYHSN